MSNDSAEKRQSFERWVSGLRKQAGGSPITVGEESGITSLDDQKTLVRLPKDLVRQLREREAGRHLPVDQDSTAIFQPPPELLARARRLAPPKKPERSEAPSAPADALGEPAAPLGTPADALAAPDAALGTPAEPLPEPLPTPLVAGPLPEEVVVPEELRQPPPPVLSDAEDWEEMPAMPPFSRDAAAPPLAELAPPFAQLVSPAELAPLYADLAPPPRRSSRLAWAAVVVACGVLAACVWFALTH